jgi:hypothetical protein
LAGYKEKKKERSPAKKAAGYVIVSTNIVVPQVDRLKAEVYQSSRNSRIKLFKTFSVSTIFGSIRDESRLYEKPKRFDKLS